MSKKKPRLGSKVRNLRRRAGFTQVHLAAKLEISPSYLNLIEHNHRPLTAALLIKLAQMFHLDLQSFSTDDDVRLVSDLMEVFGDPIFEHHALSNTDIQDLSSSSPAVGRSILTLYQAFRAATESASTMASRLFDSAEGTGVDASRLPNEEVNDLIQERLNHFPVLEEGAERLWKEAKLELGELFEPMRRYLESTHGVRTRIIRTAEARGAVRRYDGERKELLLSEVLAPRSMNFQVAYQVALLRHGEAIDELIDGARFSSDEGRALGRVALANYFAGAVLMPYTPFRQAAIAQRYDVELLGHRFRASFEQICHRMTSLRRPGAEGVPFHFVRVDIAGNIGKRFSASGIRFARFGAACPRWNVHAAFLTPGQIRVQLSRMTDGTPYFCFARTIRRGRGGFHAPHSIHAIAMGCEVEHARQLVYSDGVDLAQLDAAQPIGITCRLCERLDCADRAFPPLQHRLKIDVENRGPSLYTALE